MKFYDCKTAPSPRRVRMFMAEKGIEIPTVQVDLASGEQLGEAYRRINPRCTVPALVLDDGSCLTDSLAICTYLESVHPEPILMGRDGLERARILGWNERIMLEGFMAAAEALRNHARGFRNRALTGPVDYEQIPALAERGRKRLEVFFGVLEDQLAGSPFVVGERFTMADIGAYICTDFAAWVKIPVLEQWPAIRGWHEKISERPSSRA